MLAGCSRSSAPFAASRGLSQSRLLHRKAGSPTAAAADGGAGSGAAGDGGSSANGGGPAVSSEYMVHIEYRGRQIQAPRGATLRTAMLEAGVTPHNGRATLINCRGLGTCGTCAVEVRGAVEPAEWRAQERLRLNFPPHGPPGNARLRLACQLACQGDLTVVKRSGFWGQGEEVLPALPDPGPGPAGVGAAAAQAMPLGQLEFVLDRRRQRSRQQRQQ
ncbi:hypothetical protein ABPG77_010898 [Micractinium sp. CCAP 211/92]